MSTLVAACAGLGLLLIYLGMTAGPRRSSSRSLDRLIAESGAPRLTGPLLLISMCCAALVVFLGVAGTTGSFIPAVTLAVGAGYCPLAYVRSIRVRRRALLRDAWPDALATMVAGLRAGISLPEVCSSLASSAPESLRPGFAAFAASYRAAGSFEGSLERLRASLADPIADRVTTILLLAHEVGGPDLVRVLRTLGDFIREDLRVRKEIEARWSWTITAARLAAASPWIVLLMMVTRPEAAAAFDSSGGIVVIISGALATVMGYRLMLWVARLPEEKRHVF